MAWGASICREKSNMQPLLPSRRGFLKTSAGILIAAGGTQRIWAAAGPTADRLIAGKDPRLVVHNAKVAEIETPLELLREHRFTPKELLFVRNNQSLAGSLTVAPLEQPDWKIEISGLVSEPASVTVGELLKLDSVEEPVILQCSGNGRYFYSQSAPCAGAPWKVGSVGQVNFRGVPLKAVFASLKLEPQEAARYLTAEGKDAPGPSDKADFEHSIPLDVALDRSLLALEMNGEPLPAVHGGPVRLVTPGYYGTMNVKWVGHLRLEASESANYHQVERYRTPLSQLKPGDDFNSTLQNSEPNWDMRIKSMIFAPLDGERVAAGLCELRGVAWNGGQSPIAKVEVSTDGGGTWEATQLIPAAGRFGWTGWRRELALPTGEHMLQARATDEQGQSQPLDPATGWNPAGYCYSGIHSVRVTAV